MKSEDSSFATILVVIASIVLLFNGDPSIAESLRVIVANAAALKP